MSVCLSVCLSICLSDCLSVCLRIVLHLVDSSNTHFVRNKENNNNNKKQHTHSAPSSYLTCPSAVASWTNSSIIVCKFKCQYYVALCPKNIQHSQTIETSVCRVRLQRKYVSKFPFDFSSWWILVLKKSQPIMNSHPITCVTQEARR